MKLPTAALALALPLVLLAAPSAAGDEALVIINGNPQLEEADVQAIEAFEERAQAAQEQRMHRATLEGYLARMEPPAAGPIVLPDESRFGPRADRYRAAYPMPVGLPYFGGFAPVSCCQVAPSRAVLRTPTDAEIRAYQHQTRVSASEATRALTRVDVVR